MQNSRGTIRNIGGRLREELEFVPKWTLAAGIGFQQSQVSVQTINYTAGALGSSPGADRTFYNWAPEVSVSWRPTEQHRHWVRASTGYSVPGFANLTTGLDGLAGTNFSIKPQKNYNFEIGTDSKLHKTFGVQLVGFWVLVKDEIITQVTQPRLVRLPSTPTPPNIGASRQVMIGGPRRDGASPGPIRISTRNTSTSPISSE